MQISEERQASRLRITKLEVGFAEVVESFNGSDDEVTMEEVVMALLNQAAHWQNNVIIEATPNPET